MTRRLVPVLLAALVLLSGCTGVFDTGTTADETTTPEELDPAEADLPPGVNESGVENASSLAAAHNETLLAEGYVLNSSSTTNSSTFGNRTTTAQWVVGPSADRFTFDARTSVHTPPSYDGPAGDYRQRLWGGDSVVTRIDRGNETTYNNVEALASRLGVAQSQTFERYLDIGAYDVERVVTDGEHTFTTLAATEPRDDAEFNGTFEARFVVDERGVVHEVDVHTDQRMGDYEQRIEYRLVELGASPERPDWVSEVPDVAFENVSVDADVNTHGDGGSTPYLTVTNEGPDTLPAGAELNVTTNEPDSDEPAREETLNAVLRTGAPLDPGESVYVYRSGDTLELTRDEATAKSGDGLRSSVSVAVSADGVSFGSFGMGWSSSSASESASSGTSGSASGSASAGSGSASTNGTATTTTASA
ncbi:hypothetical protein [Halomarina rubra]|uniref:Uncharacterized protein n=1 Tax=Halomarina rubra TaxID=2071873 RepID=A0ABD6AV31_9EURY|nr:hypothetical protein [Halomarina rubra]